MDEVSTKQGNRIRQKSSWFIGTTKNLDNMESICNNLNEFKFYCYIFHDKDENTDKHLHFVLNCSGCRSIKSICDALGCDYTVVQKALRPKSAIRYLIHKDNPDKFQYSPDNIFTNNSDRLNFYLSDQLYISTSQLYSDFCKVENCTLSVSQFIDKYSHEFSDMPFYQRIKTMEVLCKMTRFKR